MAEKKMTRAQAVEIAIAAVENDEAKEILVKMHTQLTKPRKKSDAPSKTRIQNENLANQCVAAIAAHGDEPVTGKWLQEHVRGLMSPQKTTAVMKIAIEDGRVVKEKDGKNTVYRLA